MFIQLQSYHVKILLHQFEDGSSNNESEINIFEKILKDWNYSDKIVNRMNAKRVGKCYNVLSDP